jgi:DNA-binding SARP family transcriptional activator
VSTVKAQYRLRTLGALTLSDAAGHSVLPGGKPVAMLAYLACAPNRTVSRPLLVDLFWSDKDENGGRHALRTALWELRRRLGDDAITADADALSLAPIVTCDRDAFLDAVQNSNHSAAVAAYHGDFMPDFAAPGCGEFEQWADLERRQLRLAFVRCADVAARRELATAHWREAQRIARLARDADPSNERTWRLLLETLLSGGDGVEAAMEALKLQRTWADDERDLEPETIRLVTSALGATSAAAGSTNAPAADAPARRLAPDLVGRASEFATRLPAWDTKGAPRGAHLHIEAPAGLGKTRLLEEFRRRLRTTRARVVLVSASLSDRDLAYSLASDLAGALANLRGARGISRDSAGALVALNPSLATVFDAAADTTMDEEALRRRSLAFEELLSAVAEERPLALLVDDVHWADPSSLRMLRRLVRRAREVPCLLLTAGRAGSALAISTETNSVVDLSPLGVLEVTELVTSLAALPEAPWVTTLADDLLTASRGSPLVLIETLSHLCDTGALRLEERTWKCDNPERLRDIVLGGEALRLRAASLPALESSLMLTLATLGSGAEIALLSAVCGADSGAVYAALTRLERDGLARRASDGQWSCAHDEIGAAVVAESSRRAGVSGDGQLATIHSRIATAYLRDDTNLVALRRAGVHALAARDDNLLALAFRRWSVVQRGDGASRTPTQLAREFLSVSDDEARIVRLAALLPRQRPSVYMIAGVAAASLALVFVLQGLVKPAPPSPARDAFTIITPTPPSEGKTIQVSLTDGSTRFVTPPVQPLDGDRMYKPNPTDSNTYAFSKPTDDGGEEDIFLSRAGSTRRLTKDRGDDSITDWSPDGRYLVFSTGRWDPEWFSDIGRYEVATGKITPLVHMLGTAEGSAMWSPDGTRIAFARRYMNQLKSDELCWTHSDGSSPVCTTVDGFPSLQVEGWRGANTIVFTGIGTNKRTILAKDLETRAVRVLDVRQGRHFLSPDGALMLCQCVSKAGTDTWQLSPTSDIEASKAIAIPNQLTVLGIVWHIPRPRPLARLTIAAPLDSIPSTHSYQLRVSARDASGASMEAEALRWSVSDTSIATIDSTGLLAPRRAGRLLVRVSAGGWVTDSTYVEIAGPRARRVFQATWEPGGEGWKSVRPFGAPRPRPIENAGRWSFHNNGDGSFQSGAYTKASWSGADGLTLLTSARLHITKPAWQSISLGLVSGLRDSLLARWDHDSSYIKVDRRMPQCEMSLPAMEGPAGATIGTLGSNVEAKQFDLPRSARSGDWFQIRLDIRADGRCSVDIDGMRMAEVRGQGTAAMRFLTLGQSNRTLALVGPVEIWSGIANQPPPQARP